jgi:hypothetical protein
MPYGKCRDLIGAITDVFGETLRIFLNPILIRINDAGSWR